MHLTMSVLVLVAGLFVLAVAEASPDMRIFGGVVAVIGAVGVAAAVLRRRARGSGR